MGAVKRQEKLVDKNELSELTGLTARHIDALKDRGEIPFYKIGRLVRFYPSEIFKYLDQRRVSTVGKV
jgi:excisionase family DNA binding protein